MRRYDIVEADLMSASRRGVLIFGLALAAGDAAALTQKSGALESAVVVTEGQALFCQPDGSLTILDARTGRPLVRDTEARCEGWLRLTDHGPLLSTHWNRYRMIDVAQSVEQGRLVARWELGSAKGGGRSSRVIDDRVIFARAGDFVVESRSLADNALQWSYEAPGPVGDIVPRAGRVLLQSGDYRLARHVSVVDLGTGRPLFREDIEQDAAFEVRSFDGERIVLAARPPVGSACKGVVVRTLTPMGGRLVAQDACGQTPPPWQPTPAPDLEKEWSGKQVSLRFTPTSYGTWIEGVGNGVAWRAFARGEWRRLARIHEGEGVLVLERATRAVASLECLDAATGRPRWLYVYNPFRYPSSDWDAAKTTPPRETVRAIESGAPGSRPSESGRQEVALYDRATYPAPVTFDPAPLRPRPNFLSPPR